MDKLQITRVFHHRRHNYAWWDAKKVDNLWNVHFHADYVPSQDWVASNDLELFDRIENDMRLWILAIENRSVT